MIWLAVGIVIGVVVTVVGGILLLLAAVDRKEGAARALSMRRDCFIALVGMECSHRDRLALQQGERAFDPAFIYYWAMRVDPGCLPRGIRLYEAAMEFVAEHWDGREPDWVQYLPEGEGS